MKDELFYRTFSELERVQLGGAYQSIENQLHSGLTIGEARREIVLSRTEAQVVLKALYLIADVRGS